MHRLKTSAISVATDRVWTTRTRFNHLILLWLPLLLKTQRLNRHASFPQTLALLNTPLPTHPAAVWPVLFLFKNPLPNRLIAFPPARIIFKPPPPNRLADFPPAHVKFKTSPATRLGRFPWEMSLPSTLSPNRNPVMRKPPRSLTLLLVWRSAARRLSVAHLGSLGSGHSSYLVGPVFFSDSSSLRHRRLNSLHSCGLRVWPSGFGYRDPRP